MSNAKICDNCMAVFPEGADGAESGVATVTRTQSGHPVTQQVVRDSCPECVACRPAPTGWRPRELAARPQDTVAR